MRLPNELAVDKVCSRCENAWPATPEYWYSGGNRNRLHSWCIPCFQDYYRQRKAAP